MSFGDRMKEARKLNKMSQQELADILGISVNSIANYERGTSFPKEDYLYKIINILGLDPNYLFQDIIDVNTGMWFEEMSLLSNYRSLDKKSRFFVDYIVKREKENQIGEMLADKSEAIDFLCLDVMEGIYGRLTQGHRNNRSVGIKKSAKADYIVEINGDGLEPVFFCGDYLSIKYEADISENQLGLYNIDGFTTIAVKKGGNIYSIFGKRINMELLNREPVLYGKILEYHKKERK